MANGAILLHLRESYRHGKLNLKSKNTTTAASASISVPHSDESNILDHVNSMGNDNSRSHPFASQEELLTWQAQSSKLEHLRFYTKPA